MEKEIVYRHNVMNINSLDTFLSIKGGFNGNRRDVYFVRALGCGPDIKTKIIAADQRMGLKMRDGTLFYTRVKLFPPLISQEDMEFYASQFEELRRNHRLYVKNQNKDERFGRVLGASCLETIAKYRLIKKNITDSIEKNFVVKLLYWTDYVLGESLADWNERKCFKLLVENVQKEQEYLLCYMLTMLGCDVLVLECQKDIATLDILKGLSREFRLGEFNSALQLPEYRPFEPDEGGIKDFKQEGQSVVSNRMAGSSEKNFEELALLASSIVMIAVYNRENAPIATGSGIMIGRNGYILTNYHVTRGGCFFAVRIEDDENIYKTQEIIKYNSVLDLAVIRIDRQLKPLPIYKGKKLVRGQKVVAIGSPLGMFNSVSDGIISGFRKIDTVDMIQFTAPISHGSSGGAVLNMQGEVIGISTAGFDEGQNINLAVNYEDIRMFVIGFTG